MKLKLSISTLSQKILCMWHKKKKNSFRIVLSQKTRRNI